MRCVLTVVRENCGHAKPCCDLPRLHQRGRIRPRQCGMRIFQKTSWKWHLGLKPWAHGVLTWGRVCIKSRRFWLCGHYMWASSEGVLASRSIRLGQVLFCPLNYCCNSWGNVILDQIWNQNPRSLNVLWNGRCCANIHGYWTCLVNERRWLNRFI